MNLDIFSEVYRTRQYEQMDFKVLKLYFCMDFKDFFKGLWTEYLYWFVTSWLLRFSFCDITNPTAHTEEDGFKLMIQIK